MNLHPGPECPCMTCRKLFGAKLGREEVKPCFKCGSPMLRLSQWERDALGPEQQDAQWGCHNDACELNRVPAAYEIGASIGVFLRFLVRGGKAAFVLGVLWLLWRALR